MSFEQMQPDSEERRKDTEASVVNDPVTTERIKEILNPSTKAGDLTPAELQDGKDWQPVSPAQAKAAKERRLEDIAALRAHIQSLPPDPNRS